MEVHPRAESCTGRRGPARRRSSKDFFVDLTSLEEDLGGEKVLPVRNSNRRSCESSSQASVRTVGCCDSFSSYRSMTKATDHPLQSLEVSDTSPSQYDDSRLEAKKKRRDLAKQAFARGRSSAAAAQGGGGGPSGIEKELIDLKVELAEAKAEIEQANHSSSILRNENTFLRTELVSVRTNEEKLKQELAKLREENARRDVQELKLELDEDNARLEAQRLKQQLADLEEDNARLERREQQLQQQQRGRRRRSSRDSFRVSTRSRSRDSCGGASRRSSGTFEALAKAVESMLGPEIDVDKSCDGDGSQSLCGDDGDGDVPRTIIAPSSDAGDIECELNCLAIENDRLTEQAEILRAERDELKARLDEMMTIEVEVESDESKEGEVPSSLRGFMTKMTSFRNAPPPLIRRASADSLLWDSFTESNAEVSAKFDRLEGGDRHFESTKAA